MCSLCLSGRGSSITLGDIMLIGEELAATICWTGFTVSQAILTGVVLFFKLVVCLWVLWALAFAVIRAVRFVFREGLLGPIAVGLVWAAVEIATTSESVVGVS